MSAVEGVHDQPEGAAADGRLKVFINYRRGDAAGWARALHGELADAFGAENVFLDVVNLVPGTKWLDEIQSHGSQSAVFLVLIGMQWAETMQVRARQQGDDQVRNEIQLATALGATLVPTLVGGATLPEANEIPRELEHLLRWEAFTLHPESFDADVTRLVGKIEQIEPRPAPGRDGGSDGLWRPPPRDSSEPPPGTDPAMREHFEFVVERMLEGGVVPILGTGANSTAREERWQDPNAGCLPDSAELAEYLARTFRIEPTNPHLAEIAQQVAMNQESKLYQTLTRSLTIRPPIAPTPVHEFLAGLPGTLRRLRVPEEQRRPQLIVTANYDEALERAFDKADPPVPYDLAVYMATGPDRGHFVHLPYEGEPEVVPDGTTYDKFPIDWSGDLTRTVIVKIHGAVDRRKGRYTWGDNYVLTEDDYIDYLSSRTVPEVVPHQILATLRGSHLLFLGYAMRDWNLRVFVQRIFGDRPIRDASWAIQRERDELDVALWRKQPKVEVHAMPLHRYVEQLGAYLERAASVPAMQ